MGDRFPEIMTATKFGSKDWARGKRQEAWCCLVSGVMRFAYYALRVPWNRYMDPPIDLTPL